MIPVAAIRSQRDIDSYRRLLFVCIELRQHRSQAGFDATLPHVVHDIFLSCTSSASSFPLVGKGTPTDCPDKTKARRNVDKISAGFLPPRIADLGDGASTVDGSGKFIRPRVSSIVTASFSGCSTNNLVERDATSGTAHLEQSVHDGARLKQLWKSVVSCAFHRTEYDSYNEGAMINVIDILRSPSPPPFKLTCVAEAGPIQHRGRSGFASRIEPE